MNRPDTPTAIEAIKRISTEVPVEELYNNLAEEAAELAQAALKMNRIQNSSNPTPVTIAQAWDKLTEEYTDVLNVADRILKLKPNWMLGDFKLHRWCKRLDEAKEQTEKSEEEEEYECELCKITFDE